MESRVHPEFKAEFPDLPKELLKSLLIAANKASVEKIAIVGGLLRDKVIQIKLNQPIKKIYDLDLVIEGSLLNFIEEIKKYLGESNVTIVRHSSSFKTISLSINGVTIDIARARTEVYPKPAENPKILESSIEKDLFRRDFTINSMALDLREEKIIDNFGGINDILERKLEFIHCQSVEDDPTRVFRAARYAARLDFKLSYKSINQIKDTINSWPWKIHFECLNSYSQPALSTRLKMELELLFKENNYKQSIELLQSWGGLLLLDKNIQSDKSWDTRISKGLSFGLSPLTTFISVAEDPNSLGERLDLSKSEKRVLKESLDIIEHFKSTNLQKITKEWTPFDWCNFLESAKWQPDSIALAIVLGIPVSKQLSSWLREWRLIKSETTAKDLLSKGWEQGPKIGAELRKLRDIELKNLNN